MSIHLKAALFCLLPTVAMAATIDPVVVSATRSPQSTVTVPASITVIDRDAIEASGAANITELLRGHGGIQLRDLFGDGSRAQISMRGFSGGNAAANVLILVDGRRLNNTDLGGPDFNSISLADVRQVEIIQGSAGTLFGDQAVGGVINVITRQGKGQRADIEVGVGSFEARTLSASLSQRLENGLGVSLTGEARDSDNYRENNASRYRNGAARLGYQHAAGELFVEAQSLSDYLELPGALSEAQLKSDRTQSNPLYPNDLNDSETQITRFGLTQNLSANWNLEAEVSQRLADIEGVLYGAGFEQQREQTSLTPRLIGTLPMNGGEALVTLGIDHHTTDYSNLIPSWFIDTESEQAIRAYYAQAVVPLGDELSLTVGGRHATVDNDITDGSAFPTGGSDSDSVSVYELGLAWQLDADSRLFVRRDGNYRFALTDENTFTAPAVDFLDTQTGVSWEGGYEWRNAGHRFKTVVYRLDLDNEIDFDSSADGPWGPGSGANINLAATHRSGLILEGQLQASDTLTLAADYTYTNAEIDGGSFDGNTIPFVAEQVLRVTADWRWHPHSALYLESIYTGERYQDADYSNALERLGSQNVVHGQLRYFRGPWRAALRVNNLTDTDYSDYATFNSYYPSPGRHFMLTTGYAFR